MEHSTFKSKVLLGLFWKFFERVGVQLGQLIIQLILARLLLPSDFGNIAIIMIFISFANVFIESGFSQALIQKKDADDLDFSTVFYFSFFLATIFYIIIFLTAPLIEYYFNSPEITKVIRVYAIVLFFGSISSIQTAFMYRAMEFEKFFYRSIGWIITQASVGITLAYMGYGIWALVISQICATFIGTLILYIIVGWRPKLCFSLKRLIEIYKFSSRLLISSLIEVLFNNIYTVIIGKSYSKDMLGYYNRGQNMPNILVKTINNPIANVMFPTLSKVQDDKETMKKIIRRTISISCFVIFPMLIGLAAISEPLTILLLTEKWSASVKFMQISCITFSFFTIHTTNLQAINSIGRSDLFLKLEVLRYIITIIVLFISVRYGIYALMWGAAIVSILRSFINAYPMKKLFSYTFKEQISDTIPSLIIACLMGVLTYQLNFVISSYSIRIIIQMVIGITMYLTLAYFFRFESFFYIVNIIKKFFSSKRC